MVWPRAVRQSMADVDFDEFEGGYGASYGEVRVARGRRWANIAGALTSTALILGLGVWGYKIAVRDVMGIPVVRALEGPMRVAPETPGGEVAAHQGLSVNGIAAEGTAAPTADRLVLAPRPVELSLDDAPGLASEAPAAEAAAPPAPPADQMPTAAAAPEAVTPAAYPLDANADVAAAADAPSAADPTIDPVAEAAAAAVAEQLAARGAEATPDIVPGGIARSLRPLARPAALQTAALASGTAEAAGLAPVAEVDPATLTAGTRLVQLGAFDDAETARKEWDKLAGQFGELLAGKARVVQSAQSGGRTFFRLRAHGFDGEDDARRFCSALLAENAACIPVAVR